MNDEAGFMKTVMEYGWGVILALLGLVWKSNEDKLKSMVVDTDKKFLSLNDRITEVKKDSDDEQTIQRGHIAKIFDKLEDNNRRSEDRQRELLNALHDGLSRKADK